MAIEQRVVHNFIIGMSLNWFQHATLGNHLMWLSESVVTGQELEVSREGSGNLLVCVIRRGVCNFDSFRQFSIHDRFSIK